MKSSSLNIISSTRVAYQNWREPEHLHTLAHRYWHVMLTLSVVMMLAMIGYGAYSLVTVSDDTGTHKTIVAPPTVDKARLTWTISGFANRQSVFESLKVSADVIADPSRTSKD